MKDKRKKLSTLNIVIIAMFVALLSVSSYISVPLPNGSHITFLNFTIVLTAFCFPVWQAGLIILIWLLLGAAGVPVFISGASGLGYLLSPWGGFNFAFLVTGIVFSFISSHYFIKAGNSSAENSSKKFAVRNIILAILTVLSVIFIDVLGTIWYMVSMNISVKAAILTAFLPFIPLDLVKAIALVPVIPFVKKLVTSVSEK